MKNRIFNDGPGESHPQQGKYTSKLVGIGLDNHDGHKRITSAEQFSVVGGSEETHSRMTETLCKTMEDLGKKGKTLKTSHPEEIVELLHKHS